MDMTTPEITVVATGLRFPEGPVWCRDGSVLLVEIERQTLSRVAPDGTVTVVAEIPGGPNGAAIGPDGAAYITNNGGCFEFMDLGGMLIPGGVPDSWTGGCIQRVDLATGAVTTLYTECNGIPLRAPNDLVFDAHGGFWFTDHGVRQGRSSDRTSIYYAKPDGSSITEVLFPLDAPNGIGLSPDGTRLMVAETHTGRVWWWAVTAPGEATGANFVGPAGGELLFGAEGFQLFDSLAVDGEGHTVVGTLSNGGLTDIAPDGTAVHIPLPDLLVTNVCFGGDAFGTAFATLSGTGQLISFPWVRAGLELAHTI